MTRQIRLALILPLAALALSACTHVKGVVLDDRSRQPVTNAEFTVGHPADYAIYSRHHVDNRGRFDFYIGGTDENFLYVWDGRGDPSVAPRKIQRTEIGTNMTIYMHSGGDW